MLDLLVYAAVEAHIRLERARACWRAYRHGLAVQLDVTLPPELLAVAKLDVAALLVDPATGMISHVPMRRARIRLRAQDAVTVDA